MSTPKPQTQVSSSSKKIQKPKSSRKQPKTPQTPSDDGNSKIYKTVPKDTKKLILADLTKGLIAHLIGQGHLQDTIPEDTLSLIEMARAEEYNKILARVYCSYNPNFEATTKNLTQLRKKIKNWISAVDKDETRGGLVVAPNQLKEFLERVNKILDEIPCRSWDLLQAQLIQVVKEFNEKIGKEFTENTCSKHWWFNFIRSHEEIKDKWEAIPLERSLKKQQKKKQASSETLSDIISTPSIEESQISSPDVETEEINHQIEEEKEEELSNWTFNPEELPSPFTSEQTNENFIKEAEARDNFDVDKYFSFFGDSRDFMAEEECQDFIL
jgi:hypothetical protein